MRHVGWVVALCLAGAAIAAGGAAIAQADETGIVEFESASEAMSDLDEDIDDQPDGAMPDTGFQLDASLFPLTESSPLAAVAPADQLRGGARPEQTLLFGGFDVWRNGYSVNGAFEWAPGGQGDDGPIVRFTMSDGAERYRTRQLTYTTDIFRGSLQAGWRIKHEAFELKLLAGPDFESRKLAPIGGVAGWQETHLGFRIAAEAWAQPTPDLMLTSSVYATTIAGGYGFRAAAGLRLADAFWIGPEVTGARDEFSRQTRIGVHLTGLALAAFDWSAAAGYLGDSFGRSGLYTRVAAVVRP